MSMNAPVARRPHTSRDLVSTPETTNLADLLERVLDKGVVVAGDIVIALGAVELLTLKIRLLIASIDKARELGIDWWEHDAFLSSKARERELEGESDLLRKRLDRLERLLLAPPQEGDHEHAEMGQWSNAAPTYVLDKHGKVIAELKPPLEQVQAEEQPPTQGSAPQPAEQPHEEADLQAQRRAPQPHEEEPLHAPEPPPQPQAAQAEQPAGDGRTVDQALHERITQAEHIARAMQPALEELRRPTAQAQQPGEQARPEGRHDEEQPQEQEQPHAPQPEAAQAELPTGAGPLLGPALHERIAQAMRPVLEGLPQRIAQAGQPGEQAQPEGRHDEAQEQEEEQLHAPQPEAAPNAAPARVFEEEGRKNATPRHGRVTWRLAVVDLDREGRVIAEPKQPVEQAQEDEQNAAPAYILDKQGRVIAELEQPVEQAQEDEGPQVQERAPQPEAAQAEHPAGAGPLLAPALHAHIAQAMQSVLEELRQRNAQARPEGWHAEGQPPQQEQFHVPERAPQPQAAQTPAPTYIRDKKGKLLAELKLPLEQAQEDEGSLVQKRAPQPESTQAQQPAGAGSLLVPALHAHLARAMQPVLEELRQRNAQAQQPGEQGRPVGRHDEAQPPQQEPPHALERAPLLEALQAEQPAGAQLLLAPALHTHLAQAMQPVLAELRQRNAQARQSVARARPEG